MVETTTGQCGIRESLQAKNQQIGEALRRCRDSLETRLFDLFRSGDMKFNRWIISLPRVSGFLCLHNEASANGAHP